MNISEALKILFLRTGTTQKHAAEKLGYKSSAYISNVLSRGNLTLETLARLCQALDYTIILRPNNIRATSEEIVIDMIKKKGRSRNNFPFSSQESRHKRAR